MSWKGVIGYSLFLGITVGLVIAIIARLLEPQAPEPSRVPLVRVGGTASSDAGIDAAWRIPPGGEVEVIFAAPPGFLSTESDLQLELSTNYSLVRIAWTVGTADGTTRSGSLERPSLSLTAERLGGLERIAFRLARVDSGRYDIILKIEEAVLLESAN